MKYDERACKFNMDTGCVELLLRDGRMISIDCTGVEDEFASSFIVLHNRVLSALRHLYSCDFCYTVLLIRFWTHSRREGAFILLSEENKKSEPFSY